MTKFRKYWTILYLIGIVMGIIFFLSQPSDNEICIQQYKKERSSGYRGKVIKKFLDSTEHNYKTVVLNNNRSLWMNWDLSGLYNFIQPNDSIVKDTGSYEVRVYRDSTEYKFIIDYGCDNMKQKLKD